MATKDIVFRMLNKAANAFIEPRREDGHGSAVGSPSFSQLTESDAIVGFTSPSLTKRVEQGVVFMGGARHDAGSGQSMHLLIENPAGSGLVFIVFAFSAYTDLNETINASFFINETATGGSPVATQNLNFGSANTSQAVVTSGVDILDGVGTELSPRSKFTRREHLSVQNFTFRVPAGGSAALEATTPSGLASTSNTDANAFWLEVPA